MRILPHSFCVWSVFSMVSASAISSASFASALNQVPSEANQQENAVPLLGGRKSNTEALRAGNSTYQLGDEWGKKKVTPQLLASSSEAFKRDAYATAKVGGATGFYLGTFNGHHLMATNHHVLEDADACLGRKMNFPLYNRSFKCTQFFGSWTDIDLALFAIDVPNDADLKNLESVGRNFKFDTEFTPGMPLVTIGFGVGNNPFGALMGNEDSDCKVFSAQNEFHFMADPDHLNPGPYKAWSFANGCDVSHGDSGSAMVDRSNGDVVGIIWTGRIPKSEAVQHSSYLDSLLKTQNPEIWEELSYAVPAPKMLEFFSKLLAEGSLDADASATLQALISPKN